MFILMLVWSATVLRLNVKIEGTEIKGMRRHSIVNPMKNHSEDKPDCTVKSQNVHNPRARKGEIDAVATRINISSEEGPLY